MECLRYEAELLDAAPRLAYLLRGLARTEWQHSIPPARTRATRSRSGPSKQRDQGRRNTSKLPEICSAIGRPDCIAITRNP